jgi:hypothetical protein
MKSEDIYDELSDYQLLKKDSSPCSNLWPLFISQDHLQLHIEITDIDFCANLYEIFTVTVAEPSKA